jgi:hypothetical protein
MNRKAPAAMFAGWDWASSTHDVTVLDEHGGIVDRCAFTHTEKALSTALRRLTRHCASDSLPSSSNARRTRR